MRTKNESSIKLENMNRIWHLLRGVERATIAQLADWSELSVVTTTALTKELLQLGQIEQDSIVQPQVGRPAIAYRFAAEFKLILIIYMLEREQLDIAHFSICDLHGSSIFSTQETISNPSLSSFDEMTAALLKQFPSISYIGLGLPVGSEQEGRLVASDYPSLQNSALRAHFIERFRLPTVIENDINAATLGYCFAHNREKQCVVSMFCPHKYTPGAGICLNGAIVKGRDGLAGACQHLPYGEEWQKYRDDPQKQIEIVVMILRMTMCLLNPHAIVLYWDRPASDIASQLRKSCLSDTEKILIPELVLSDQLEQDFKTGLTHLTLNALFEIML